MEEELKSAINGRSKVLVVINDQLQFQKKWKTLSMAMYSTSSIGSIICTGSATILAALKEYSIEAAVLAAVATILLSIEKSLLFREKWKHHLYIYTSLSALKLEYEVIPLSEQEVLTKLEKLLDKYSSELPFDARK